MKKSTTLLLVLTIALFGALPAVAGGLTCAIDGYLAQCRGDYHKAIEHYTEAIKKGKLCCQTMADIHTNRGTAWKHLGDYQHALRDYTKAIEHNPNCAMAYNNRGALLARMGRSKEAQADYAKAIELASATGSDLATYTRANGQEAKESDPLAKEAAQEQALVRRKAAALAYFNRANMYLDQGSYQKALDDYDQAIGLDPRMAKAYFNRALARESLKQYDAASRDLKIASSLEPGRANYQMALNRMIARGKAARSKLASQ